MSHRWLLSLCAAALIASPACKSEPTKPDEEVTEDTVEEPTETESSGETADAEEASGEESGEKLPPPENVASVPADAETGEDGLAWVVLTEGSGEAQPTIDSTVTVHYTGWTTDGEMFDSSVVRGEPATFPLSKLIVGWQKGIPKMKKGEKRRFWIPGEMAYDKSTREGVPKGMLVFDIELVDFETNPTTGAPAVEEKE